MIHAKKYVWSLVLFSSLTMKCWSGTYVITDSADDGLPGSLRGIIQQINASSDTSNTVTTMPGVTLITLGSPLTPLVAPAGSTTSIDGGGMFLSGSSAYSAFSLYQGNLQLSNFQIFDVQALGGTGGSGAGAGGGGAGLGGGLFVRAGSNVTLTNVLFENNSAVGGNGGTANGSTAGGGGGGLVGNGGSSLDVGLGGGGGGFIGAGGNGDQAGGGGGALAASPGGSAGAGDNGGGGGAGTTAGGVSSTNKNGGAGGASNGAGGGGGGGMGAGTGGTGSPPSGASGANGGDVTGGGDGGLAGPFGGGGGGGYAGTPTAPLNIADGGNGGSGVGDALDNGGGGGGGGGQFSTGTSTHVAKGNGGAGGFGSGGGGSGQGLSTASGYGGGAGGLGGGGGGKGPDSTGISAGSGGFGGGGGGDPAGSPGTGGEFGGSGGTGPGGGGAGLGGAIFLETGPSSSATLTIMDGCAFTGNTVNFGTGANSGQALGKDLFMMSGTTLNVNVSGTVVIPDAIEANSGGSGGGLVKSGTGTLILSGTLITVGYTGGTTIDAGTLQTDSTNIIPDIGHVTVNTPGILNLNGFSQTIVNLFGTGTVELNGGATLNTGNNVTVAPFTGTINGTGIFNYVGTATYTLDGVNTYSGGTEISTSGGTLAIGSMGNLPVGGPVTMAMGTTLDISAASPQTIGNLSATTTSTLALGSNQLTYAPTSSPPNFVAEVTGSTTGVFVYDAPFLLDLDSVLAFQGTFQIAEGTVQPTVINALSNGDLLIVNANATFNLGGTSQAIGNLSGNGSVTLGGAGATLTTGSANTAATFGGTISGGNGNLIKEGTGNFTLTGINSYNGTTSITGGTLSLSGTGALPSNSPIDISPGAFLDISGATVPVVLDTISGTGTLTLGSSTLNYTPGSSATASFVLTGLAGSTFNNTQNNTTFGLEGGMDGTIEISGGSIIASAMNIFPAIGLLNVGANGIFNLNNFNQTISNITGSGIISLGTATLTTGTATSEVFSGVISGTTGGLTKQGSGNLTLTGVNTYGGTTNITAGTLLLSGNGALSPTSLIDISSGATLNISGAAAPVTLDTISGTGMVQLGSSGTLNYAPASSAIASFVLQGGAGSTFNNTQNDTTFGVESQMFGTIEISGGTITADAVNIFPNIALLNVGAAGTFSLVTFNQTISNITGSGTISLGTATLTTGSASSTTFSGDITGTGDLTKVGSGTLTLSGTNMYTGPTSVNAGTLFIAGTGTINSPPTVGNGALMIVNGTVNGATIVNAGGTLKGTGMISSTLDVFGTLQPGNSIGTITVTGPVVFHPGSTFAVEVSPTAADLLDVTVGSVTIDAGSTLALTFDPGTYTAGTVYTIIDAAGGVEPGKFSTVTVTHPVLLTPTVIYLPFSVELAFEIGAVGTFFGATGNAGAVAKCLNAFKAMPGTDIGTIFMALFTAPDAKSLQHALNQMQPSQLNGLQLSQENTGVRVLSTIESRSQMLAKNCRNSTSANGVWIDGFGDAMNQKHEQGQYGFHAATGGVVVGVDKQVPKYPDLYIGVGGSYTWTHVHWNGHHGKGNINSGYGFMYAALSKPYFFLNVAAFGAYNHYDAKRRIGFLDIDRTASNQHKGKSVGGEVDINFPIPVSCWEIAPLLGANYDYLHQNSFKEQGADSLDLKIHQKNSDLLRGKAGIRFAKTCKPCHEECPAPPVKVFNHQKQAKKPNLATVHWAPYGEVSVIREFRFHGRQTKASLKDIDCVFTVKGLNPDRTLIAPTLGVNIFFDSPRIDLNFDYSGEFALNGKFWDQKGNIQLGYAF